MAKWPDILKDTLTISEEDSLLVVLFQSKLTLTLPVSSPDSSYRIQIYLHVLQIYSFSTNKNFLEVKRAG